MVDAGNGPSISPTPDIKKWIFRKYDPKIKICEFLRVGNMLKLLGFHGHCLGARGLRGKTRTKNLNFRDLGRKGYVLSSSRYRF